MSHMLDEILAQAANGSPVTVTLSSESVAVLLFGSEFLGNRANWLDRGVDPLDEITDADWDEIEKIVGNAYDQIMTPVLYVGTLASWLTGTPPLGWLVCDGSAISRATYSELFALWGITFGPGDGSTTFNLPNTKDRLLMGADTLVDLGENAGSWQAYINRDNLPDISLPVTDPGHTHSYNTPSISGGDRLINSGGARLLNAAATTGSQFTGISVRTGGSGHYLEILNPVIGVSHIVYTGVL